VVVVPWRWRMAMGGEGTGRQATRASRGEGREGVKRCKWARVSSLTRPALSTSLSFIGAAVESLCSRSPARSKRKEVAGSDAPSIP
jgi:hypothetical protein